MTTYSDYVVIAFLNCCMLYLLLYVTGAQRVVNRFDAVPPAETQRVRHEIISGVPLNCDNCHHQIVGPRISCINCESYNMCLGCSMKDVARKPRKSRGHHSDHVCRVFLKNQL